MVPPLALAGEKPIAEATASTSTGPGLSRADGLSTPTASSTITGWPLTWADGFSAPTGLIHEYQMVA
jgi:hypothetical protein